VTADRTLAALVAELAVDLPDARPATAGGRIEWTRGGATFAVLDGGALEVRLDPAIASAALRTPDTTLSSRGLPWVRFAPGELDGQAIDRATAWFGLAYRRAGQT
jgi:hypothetical protein